MKSPQQIRDATADELREWHRNAQTTFSLCSGHRKAERNADACLHYVTEMAVRGMVPDMVPGIFNGPGSV